MIKLKTFIAVLFTTVLTYFSSQAQKETQKTDYSHYSTKTTIFSDKTTINFKKGGDIFKIEYKGALKISEDDRGIVSISKKGYLILIEYKNNRSKSIKHRITIESRRGNKIVNYFEGSSKKDYYSDGRKWLASVLPTIVKNTPVGMKSRIARFYKTGGANKVVSEIKYNINDHHTKAMYLKELLKYNCSANEIIKIAETAGSEIKSNSGLARFLKENQNSFLVNDKTVIAYVKAAGKIRSNSNLASVASSMVNNRRISDKWLSNIAVLAKKINSSVELGTVVKKIVANRTLNNENIETILKLSKEIESNSALVTIYKKIGRSSTVLSDDQLIKILSAIPEYIQSPSNLSETLITFSHKVKKSSEKVKEAYRKAAKHISSSSNYSKVMKALY